MATKEHETALAHTLSNEFFFSSHFLSLIKNFRYFSASLTRISHGLWAIETSVYPLIRLSSPSSVYLQHNIFYCRPHFHDAITLTIMVHRRPRLSPDGLLLMEPTQSYISPPSIVHQRTRSLVTFWDKWASQVYFTSLIFTGSIVPLEASIPIQPSNLFELFGTCSKCDHCFNIPSRRIPLWTIQQSLLIVWRAYGRGSPNSNNKGQLYCPGSFNHVSQWVSFSGTYIISRSFRQSTHHAQPYQFRCRWL